MQLGIFFINARASKDFCGFLRTSSDGTIAEERPVHSLLAIGGILSGGHAGRSHRSSAEPCRRLRSWHCIGGADRAGVLGQYRQRGNTGGHFLHRRAVCAVQEALESTVTADMVEADTLTMSIGALGTVNGVAKFVSSATVGVVWTAVSPVVAFALAAGFMLAGILALRRAG